MHCLTKIWIKPNGAKNRTWNGVAHAFARFIILVSATPMYLSMYMCMLPPAEEKENGIFLIYLIHYAGHLVGGSSSRPAMKIFVLCNFNHTQKKRLSSYAPKEETGGDLEIYEFFQFSYFNFFCFFCFFGERERDLEIVNTSQGEAREGEGS